jgi:hypothetical protein
MGRGVVWAKQKHDFVLAPIGAATVIKAKGIGKQLPAPEFKWDSTFWRWSKPGGTTGAFSRPDD